MLLLEGVFQKAVRLMVVAVIVVMRMVTGAGIFLVAAVWAIVQVEGELGSDGICIRSHVEGDNDRVFVSGWQGFVG